MRRKSPVRWRAMALQEDEVKRLNELEALWNQRFIEQPKLPSSALLTGAVSMALAFGGVLFLLSAWMRSYAWIWFVLSGATGILNRLLAKNWYQNEVIPWDRDRRATHAELQALRAKQ